MRMLEYSVVIFIFFFFCQSGGEGEGGGMRSSPFFAHLDVAAFLCFPFSFFAAELPVNEVEFRCKIQ